MQDRFERGAVPDRTADERNVDGNLIKAAGGIAETTIDLLGTIGRHVLDNLLPDRRCRTSPPVARRVISEFAAHTSLRSHAQFGPATLIRACPEVHDQLTARL